MEKGFYHPARGYWQTTGEPSAETLAGYPAGTKEVPLKPGSGYRYTGTQWQELPAPTPEEIAAMRAAKIDAALARVSPLAKAFGLEVAGVRTNIESLPDAEIDKL